MTKVKHIIVLHSTPAPSPVPAPEPTPVPDKKHPFLSPLANAIADIETAIDMIKIYDPQREKYIVNRGDMNKEIWNALWYYIRFTYGYAYRDDERATICLH